MRAETRILFSFWGRIESPTRQRGAQAVIPSLALRAFARAPRWDITGGTLGWLVSVAKLGETSQTVI